MKHLFPNSVSYNRFVELEKEVLPPLTIFIKKVLLGTCTGISFVDSTPLRVCRNQRILIHKTFEGVAEHVKVECSGYAKVFINLFDDACLSVSQSDEAKVYVYRRGNGSVDYKGEVLMRG